MIFFFTFSWMKMLEICVNLKKNNHSLMICWKYSTSQALCIQFTFCCVFVIWYQSVLPIFSRVVSLALGWSYHCWPQFQWSNLEEYWWVGVGGFSSVATFNHVGRSFYLFMATTADAWIISSFQIWGCMLHVGHISCVITNCGNISESFLLLS